MCAEGGKAVLDSGNRGQGRHQCHRNPAAVSVSQCQQSVTDNSAETNELLNMFGSGKTCAHLFVDQQ